MLGNLDEKAVVQDDGNCKDNKKKFVVGGIVITIIAILAFYFGYWVKTPGYSLGLIKEAIEKHDLVKFEKHVDIQNISSRAVDDFIAASMSKEDINNPLVMGMVTLVKNVAIPAFTDQVKKYVETGNFEKNTAETQDENKNDQVPSGKQVAENATDRTGAGYMEYGGVKSTQKDGKIAVVSVKMHDKQLAQDFILKIKMRELEDGTWRVTEISNLKEFIQERDKAVQAKLQELNKPISEKIAEQIQLAQDVGSPFTVERISDNNPFFAAYAVKAHIPVKWNNTHIKGFSGQLELYSQDGKCLFIKTFDTGDADLSQWNHTKGSFNKEWHLNQFISEEKQIIDADFGQLKKVVVFTSVRFNDGTDEVKLLNELPPVK